MGCLKVGRLGGFLKQSVFFTGLGAKKIWGTQHQKDMFLRVRKSFGIDGTDDPTPCDEFG